MDELVYRLSVEEAAVVVATVEKLERLTAARGGTLILSVARVKHSLSGFLGRARSLADATTRLASELAAHDEDEVDTTEAAQLLGITRDAVAKRCRTGIFVAVARKCRGDWLIPRADVLAQKGLGK